MEQSGWALWCLTHWLTLDVLRQCEGVKQGMFWGKKSPSPIQQPWAGAGQTMPSEK